MIKYKITTIIIGGENGLSYFKTILNIYIYISHYTTDLLHIYSLWLEPVRDMNWNDVNPNSETSINDCLSIMFEARLKGPIDFNTNTLKRETETMKGISKFILYL